MESHVNLLPLEIQENILTTSLELALVIMPESNLTLHVFSGT